MKKSFGMIMAIMAVGILIGTFIATKASIAGEKARDGRFIAYDNGTVLDTKTNLMWADKDNGSTIKWAEAKSYCENYQAGGYTDWRMPTQDELAGLYDESKAYASDCGDGNNVHITQLIRLRCGWVWSSEEIGLINACYFLFYNGTQRWNSKSDLSYSLRALPVRSSKFASVLPCPQCTQWNPDTKKCEEESSIECYKDGEDGVSRVRSPK
jgi:hypothetical protein